MSILKDYYGELCKLKDKGYSSNQIQKHLEEVHGVSVNSRSIREYFRRRDNQFGTNKLNVFQESAEKAGFEEPFEVKHGWLKTKEASIFIKSTAETVTFDEMRDSFMEKLKSHSPTFKKIKRKPIKDGHCLILDIADLHVGKLAEAYETGEDYNTDIAVKRALEGVKGILDKSSGFNLDKIIFIIGNDVLHIDNNRRTTTSGTPQDTYKMWYSNYLIARDMYIEIINSLVQVADVHIVHNMSNHDYVTGFMLADSVYCWFRKCKNITWDIDASHRKYFTYGKSLIGTSHGDGGKMDNLPLTMAVESEDWSKATFRYIYLHHIHHNKKFKFLTSQDFPGITVEYLRSPSGTDSWHHINGYQHATKAIEGFIHSKEYGQVAKLTHAFV